MNVMPEVFSFAASALVTAVWEGALLALLVWLCLRLIPGLGVAELSAAARSAIWLCVFVLLLGLQVVPLVLHPDSADAAVPVLHPVLHFDPRWSLALAAVWLAASLVRAGQLVYGVLYLRRLVKGATEAELSAEMRAALDEAAAGHPFGGAVRICSTDAIARPSVVGFLQPRVLIPAKLLENLSQAELKQVLIHELEHLRRADDWTNLLQKLALVVFPLNPALAWVERKLCAERELACDDRVLATGNGRKAYAQCLARLAEFALLERSFSLVLGAWERRPELARRVHRILRSQGRTMSRRTALGVSGGVLTAALCGAVALAHSPQLVSFAPMPVVAQDTTAPMTNFREGMAAPQLVRATMTMEHVNKPASAASHSRSRKNVQSARPPEWGAARTVKTTLKTAGTTAEVKLAGLRMPPPPGNGKLLVMTEWADLGAQQRMLVADVRAEETKSAAAIPAIYIVATPNGWLIVQI